MGHMPTPRQLRQPQPRTNLWFECGPQERASWVQNLAHHGGFDPFAHTMTPLRHLAQLDRAQFVLDSIAGAFESGLLEDANFLGACFSLRQDWQEFLGELAKFDDYWVNERHFYVFLHLLGDECECRSYPRIAKALSRRFDAEISGHKKHARAAEPTA